MCTAGSYGFECNETCGYCSNNDTCDAIKGECPNGCAPGYKMTHDNLCKNGNQTATVRMSDIICFS